MTLPAVLSNRAFVYPAELLEELAPDAFQPLVCASTFSDIVPFARSFPVEVQTFCFECRLAADDQRVDWAVSLFPGARIEPVLEGLPDQSKAAWQPVARFLQPWTAGRSPWSSQIPFVCAAFDREKSDAVLPAPCLSFCVDPQFHGRRLAPDQHAKPEGAQVAAFAVSVFADFTGESLPEASRVRLLQCLTQDGVEARHVSLMLGRRHAPLKLDLELELESLAAVLRSVSWPVAVDEVVSAVRSYLPWGRRAQLNLTLYPETGTTLEVEVFSAPTHAEPERRLELLDRLVAEGKADRRKTAVLRRCVEAPALHTPRRVLGTSFYLKLRFRGAKLFDVKAYFGLMPRPFQLGAGRASSATPVERPA